jgi:spermidine synthase
MPKKLDDYCSSIVEECQNQTSIFISKRDVPIVSKTTKYTEISIYEKDKIYYLITDGAVQSAVPGLAQYLETAKEQVLFQMSDKTLGTVVHLGVGAGTLARELGETEIFKNRNFKQIGIDIDGEMIQLCREHLSLPTKDKLKVRIGDAFEELEKFQDESVDVVFRDVFVGARPPKHLRDEKFLQLVLQKLKPGGLYLANIIDWSKGPELLKLEIETAHLVFHKQVQALDAKAKKAPTTTVQNYVLRCVKD